PSALYGEGRRNSAGIDLTDVGRLSALRLSMSAAAAKMWNASPLVAGTARGGPRHPVFDPADQDRKVGEVVLATAEDVDQAVGRALHAQIEWNAGGADARARCLESAADLMEQDHANLMMLAIREGGKTIPDALAEVREA